MKSLKLLLAGSLLLLLWGCDSVTSSEPPGEKPVALIAEEWNGSWLGDDGVVTLKVTGAAQGLLLAAWIEDAGGTLKSEIWNIQIRSSGGWSYASVKDDFEGQERFLFARVKKDDRKILFWLPDTEAFKSAVKAGRLPGAVNDESVRLPALDAAHLKFLDSPEGSALFDWEQPVVLLRIR